jgi:integrase
MDPTKRFGGKRHKQSEPMPLVRYMTIYAKSQKRRGNIQRAEKYFTTLRSFRRFLGWKATILMNLDKSIVREYEVYMQKALLRPNTTSFYMRNLRAMYNHAVAYGYCSQQYPFKEVFTGVEGTTKRALSKEKIRAIRDLPLKPHSSKAFARDIFMFSFYTCGMSFVDIAYLRKKDLKYGVLTYYRKKTGQEIQVKWLPEMQQIVDRYSAKRTKYMFSIVGGDNAIERKNYRNAEHLVNRNLRKIGEALKLDAPLTTYVARHSWASIAYNKQIPTATISKALGHESEKTTRIYLSRLNNSYIDIANQAVLSEVSNATCQPLPPPPVRAIKTDVK